MNRTSLIAICSVFFLCLLSGCPRSESGSTGTEATNSPPPATSSTTHETEAANPCTDNPCGDNPCADNPCNPCGDNPCADNPCNPCGENPCNPCGDDSSDVVTNVVLETTDGDIVLEVHHAWSPLGAPHFLELVRDGFYDGAPWFRVIDGFMAQTGISANADMNAKWGRSTIMDDPVVYGNKRGFVSFGTSGRNSRTAHIFINFSDNSSMLDPQGFTAFARVIEGMDILDGLYRIPDGPPGSNRLGDSTLTQGSLATPEGLAEFKSHFPDADYIKKAYIRE